MNSLKQQTASGMVYRFLERVGAKLITFVVSIVLARILMPDAYGLIALITVFITIANVFVTYGFGNSLIVYKDSDQLDFSSCFYATLFLSFVLYGILFFSAPWIASFYDNELLISIIRVMGLRLPVAAINSIQHAYVSKHMLFKRYFWSTLIGTMSSGVVGIVMALTGFGAWALVGQYLTVSIMDTVVLSITVKWRPTLEFSFQRLKRLFSFGWKVLLVGLIDVLYGNLRSLVIAKRYDEASLAYYQKGQNFPSLFMDTIEPTLNSVLLPVFVEVKDNQEKLRAIIKRSICVSGYVLAPVFVGLAVVAEPLIKVLLTEKWIESVVYMQILCIAYMLRPIQVVNVTVIKALGKGGMLLSMDALKKSIGILLIIIGMQFGIMGIAWSLVAFNFVSGIINAIPNKKYVGYGYVEQIFDLSKPIVLAVVMGVAVTPLKSVISNDWILLGSQIVLGVIVYVALSALLRFDSFVYIKKYLLDILKKRKAKTTK